MGAIVFKFTGDKIFNKLDKVDVILVKFLFAKLVEEKTVSIINPSLLLKIIVQNTWTLQLNNIDQIKSKWNYLQKIIVCNLIKIFNWIADLDKLDHLSLGWSQRPIL